MLVKSKKSSFFLFLSFFILIVPFFIFVSTKYYKISKQIVAAAETVKPIVRTIEKKILKQNQLKNIAEDSLLKNDGNYGVYIKNLKTGEVYSYNKNKKFNSASLYKLWVMAVVYQKIDSGSLNKEVTLSAPKAFLDNILSLVPVASAEETGKREENKDVRISARLGDAIIKMITLSDNYSAQLIASRIGSASIGKFLRDNNFINSNYNQPPKTTPEDIAAFYEMLYKNELENQETSTEMIEVLKKQEINDRIPKYLPRDIEVAHKTGELFGSKHDAGIVFTKKGDYIIVVMSDTKDTVEASENIAKFSKKVFDYFNG